MKLDRKILNQLWNGEKVLCPKCNKEYLIPLHKSIKDNSDWQCPNCKKIIRTMKIFNHMLKNKE